MIFDSPGLKKNNQDRKEQKKKKKKKNKKKKKPQHGHKNNKKHIKGLGRSYGKDKNPGGKIGCQDTSSSEGFENVKLYSRNRQRKTGKRRRRSWLP